MRNNFTMMEAKTSSWPRW